MQVWCGRTASAEPSTAASSARRLRLRLPPNRRTQPFRVNPEGVVATETVSVVKLRHSDQTTDLHSPLGGDLQSCTFDRATNPSFCGIPKTPPSSHNLITSTDPWGWGPVLISVTGEQPAGSSTSLCNSTIPEQQIQNFCSLTGL